jgi:hypothetical protein
VIVIELLVDVRAVSSGPLRIAEVREP